MGHRTCVVMAFAAPLEKWFVWVYELTSLPFWFHPEKGIALSASFDVLEEQYSWTSIWSLLCPVCLVFWLRLVILLIEWNGTASPNGVYRNIAEEELENEDCLLLRGETWCGEGYHNIFAEPWYMYTLSMLWASVVLWSIRNRHYEEHNTNPSVRFFRRHW